MEGARILSIVYDYSKGTEKIYELSENDVASATLIFEMVVIPNSRYWRGLVVERAFIAAHLRAD